MAEKLEDLNLPHSVIQKIIKDALPENINLGKDVKNAMARAAAMFILYITSHSTQIAQKVNRKTITPQDIYDALEETEFGQLVEPLKEALKEFKNAKQKKDGAGEDEETEDTEAISADSEENET